MRSDESTAHEASPSLATGDQIVQTLQTQHVVVQIGDHPVQLLDLGVLLAQLGLQRRLRRGHHHLIRLFDALDHHAHLALLALPVLLPLLDLLHDLPTHLHLSPVHRRLQLVVEVLAQLAHLRVLLPQQPLQPLHVRSVQHARREQRAVVLSSHSPSVPTPNGFSRRPPADRCTGIGLLSTLPSMVPRFPTSTGRF